MKGWLRHVCVAKGVHLHYVRTGGAKPPVLLLHGLMGSGACWTPLARALEGDFDVVMPDARGHGRSSAPHHGYRYDDHASDVESLIHGLDLDRPAVLGHSMGGMTAAVVASRGAAHIRGLVLVEPSFLSPERQREVRDSDVADQHRRALGFAWPELVAQARARHPHRAPEILELQAAARLQTCLAAFDVLTPPSPDYGGVVSAIDVPTLLVIAERRPVLALETAMELQRLNPRVRIEQVQDAGHGLPFEQPEHLKDVAVSFLRELT